MVVWIALTSACHSEGSILGPDNIRHANTGLDSSTEQRGVRRIGV